VSMTVPAVALDRSSPVPLYFQVAQHLESLIESGAYPPGTRLENEMVLAERLGLSRPTMRRAMEYLVDRGLLVRRRGVGTQVVQPKVRRPVALSSLFDDLRAAGQQPRTEVLGLRLEEPSEHVREALGTALGEAVYTVRRLRFTDDAPLALMTNHIPAAVLDFDEDQLSTHGLYDLLRASGVHLTIAAQSIGARSAKGAEARLLDERPGAPLLTMTRTAYDEQGRAVEFGSHLYRASRYSFSLTLTSS
jgi:DNA-binding GntR family transcriptional regulator